MLKILIFYVFVIIIWSLNLTFANNTVEIETSIMNHEFNPSVLEVPAGKKIRLTVHNKDKTVEEFESISLKREKIIPGNSSAPIILAPLKPGEYDFFGEFHEETAKGKLIVKKEEELVENNKTKEE